MNDPIAQHLRDLVQAQPFHPFIFKMVNGSIYEVPHEDFLSISRSGHVLCDDGVASFKSLNVLLIAEVSEQRPASI